VVVAVDAGSRVVRHPSRRICEDPDGFDERFLTQIKPVFIAGGNADEITFLTEKGDDFSFNVEPEQSLSVDEKANFILAVSMFFKKNAAKFGDVRSPGVNVNDVRSFIVAS